LALHHPWVGEEPGLFLRTLYASSSLNFRAFFEIALLKSFMARRSIGGKALRLRPPGRLRSYGFEERELAHIYAGADPPERRFFSRVREIRNEVRPKNYDQRRGNPLLRDESG